MRNFFQTIACCFAGMILLTSCSAFSSREITVSQYSSSNIAKMREYYRDEMASHDGLTLESQNFLSGNLMIDELDKNPLAILNQLNDYYKISGDPKYLQIASDVFRYLAPKQKLSETIHYNLSNFYYCTEYARKLVERKKKGNEQWIDVCDPSQSQAIKNYNEACAGVLMFMKRHDLLTRTSFTLTDIEGRRYIMDEPDYRLSYPKECIKDVSLCAAYKVKGLRQIDRRPGLGVTLVAKVELPQEDKALKIPAGLTVPMTFFIRRIDLANGDVKLKPVFIDTTDIETLGVDMKGIDKNFQTNMALDFSTPLAVFLDKLKDRNLLSQMLNPITQEETDGLYAIDLYQPDKIPVVFIHGLMSSPETWVQMINSLKNDPAVRQKYQFWFFSYSTGASVSYSAQKLKNALLKAQKKFCTTPEATENFNRMVLVGHSMGGLLTRMMIQEDNHYIVETTTGSKWETIKTKVDSKDLNLLENLVVEPLPFVKRVVFMAVPHKGAKMAQLPIAKLGTYLTKLPKRLLMQQNQENIERVVKALGGQQNLLAKVKEKHFTGIENLDPDDLFVKAIGTSPLKKGLPYHCVIGNKEGDGMPYGEDGVVPYWSSHLDHAQSELIVKSGHSVHRTPGAIKELLRILRLHLEGFNENKIDDTPQEKMEINQNEQDAQK